MIEKKEVKYITGKELATRLSIAEKTVSNNTYRIVGRVKIGGAVRYDWSKIQYTITMGKNPIGGK